MNFFRFLPFLSLCLCSFSSTYSQAPANGNLVIVGGGLEADNKSVFQQLISLAGGAEKATIGVLPSASGTPMQSYIYFRNILISYGVKPENINPVSYTHLTLPTTERV